MKLSGLRLKVFKYTNCYYKNIIALKAKITKVLLFSAIKSVGAPPTDFTSKYFLKNGDFITSLMNRSWETQLLQI